jgi:hypothetical protein
MDDGAVRLIIRRKIRTGTLPRRSPKKLWAGRGTGKRCAGCERVIAEHDVEIEVEDREARLIFFFHRACQALWEDERKAV